MNRCDNLREMRSLGAGLLAGLLLGVLPCPCIAVSHAQLRSLLHPKTAIKLQKGELIRYYKVRPNDRIYDIPYQVLIIVTDSACIVKTNTWEFTEKLNDAQKADLKETISYQEAKDFHRPPAPPPPPEDQPEERADPSMRIDYYLSFRKQGKAIAWNSVQFGRPQLPSLFDFLEVCHYLARKEKEPQQSEKP
jgi:hypothetical protein